MTWPLIVLANQRKACNEKSLVFESSPLTNEGFPPAGSKADSLEDKRRRWHVDLDNLLQGHLDQDDMQVALQLAS